MTEPCRPQLRVGYFDFGRVWRVAIYGMDRSGREYSAAGPVAMKEIAEGDRLEPVIEMDREGVQRLMDDLWNGGIRPSHGNYSSEAMNVLKDHLTDMRAIAFNRMGIPKP